MLSIFDVAKYILDKVLPNMSHKKLQKLCYYVQAWALAVRGSRFMDCEFQAWVHGPVCKELYDCCKYGINNVYEIPQLYEIDADDAHFIDVVLGMYGDLTGAELELLTHSEPPWMEARGGLRYWESSSSIISEDLMASYYLSELEDAMKEQ